MSFEERVVLTVFALTALLRVFRNDLILGFMTFLTEVTSNTATTQMILPILASAAGASKWWKWPERVC